MIVVSDTSPLCNLALINHLWILKEIYQTIIIPPMVADEIAAASNALISDLLQNQWIQIQPLSDIAIALQLQKERGLDAGEAHAIALAIELQSTDLLIDERLGRREARRLGVPIVGL